MSHWKWSSSKIWLVIPLLSVVLLAVACGTAATPIPSPTAAPQAAPQPAAPAAPVASPGPIPAVPVVATPVPKGAPTPAAIPTPATAVHPGKLTIMVGDLANERFDVAFEIGGSGGRNYGRVVHGYLVSTNEKREMVPGIASQWSLSANGLTWTFTVRKGVKWHDGSELTPQDVLWTLQHVFGPQALEYSTSQQVQRVSRAMDRIELSGPDKVSVNTKIPTTDFAVLISEAGDQWFHMMPKRAKLRDTEEEAAYDNNPVGAGFMTLKKHVPAYVMKFERFDDFYYQPKNGFPEDKRVNFKSLEMFLAPEEATRVAALRAGEADIVPASLPTKKQVEAGGGRLLFGQEGVVVEARMFGCYEPQHTCHDKRVRQALDYSINKELIRDRLYGGPTVFQAKGWGPFTPSTSGYTLALDPWPFDPGKARQLLADAGYPGGKGFGKLILNTWPSTAMPFLVEGAQLAADFWRRELGLDVEVRVADRTAIKKKDKTGELNGQIIWGDNETKIDASGTVRSKYGDPKANDRLHEDPELLRLVQQTFQILEPDKQLEALKKLLPRLRDESHYLGIGYVNIPWAVGPRVSTWVPYPMALFPSALHTITLK